MRQQIIRGNFEVTQTFSINQCNAQRVKQMLQHYKEQDIILIVITIFGLDELSKEDGLKIQM
jgi:F0F1-type ATP synthase beta subunit